MTTLTEARVTAQLAAAETQSDDFAKELLDKIESPISSFASDDYKEADLKHDQSDVTNRTK